MAVATYSASHVESATTFYFSDNHDIYSRPEEDEHTRGAPPSVDVLRHICIAEHSELQPTFAGLGEDDPLIHRPLDVAQ